MMLVAGFGPKHRQRRSDRGFTLLEVLFAGVVLTIGLLGLLTMVLTAINSNNRSKLDSNGTLIAQMTLETIASVPGNAITTVTITDCAGTAHSALSTTGSNAGAGANLDSNGNIDFTQTYSGVTAGYAMLYTACQASTGDRATTYDVRWNIKTPTSNTKLVTVSAQRSGNTSSSSRLQFLLFPVTLKAIVGL
jgi:Tfp pilus assembly protein PilV